jgi:hypothetical protein
VPSESSEIDRSDLAAFLQQSGHERARIRPLHARVRHLVLPFLLFVRHGNTKLLTPRFSIVNLRRSRLFRLKGKPPERKCTGECVVFYDKKLTNSI